MIMAKLIVSMTRKNGNFWVQNEAKKLLQPQGYAAEKTPKAKQRDGGKGEAGVKGEAKKEKTPKEEREARRKKKTKDKEKKK